MLYIQKKSPPGKMMRKVGEIKSSQEWKNIRPDDTKGIRAAFDSLPKEEIRQCLLEEQHYLCAYCMRRIENDGLRTSIEHWYRLCTSGNVKKKIEEIERAERKIEYAGVYLYYLKKKYCSLVARGL